jgi:hypothetical protein
MMMFVEQLVEWRLAGETEVLGQNLPQCYFAHHKSHVTWLGCEPRPPRWEASDKPPELSQAPFWHDINFFFFMPVKSGDIGMSFIIFSVGHVCSVYTTRLKLRGFSPQANYTDWATAACRLS